MTPQSRIRSLLTVVLTATLLIGACSDDNGTGPDNTGPAINMKLTRGDYFDSNRWVLDKNNQKVGSPEVFRITYLDNNNIYIEGFNNFVYLKEENRTQGVKLSDNVAMRLAQNGNIYQYSFQHDLYTYFFDLLKMIDPTVQVPTIGNQKWDLIADFNDADGKANVKGHTWRISPENMDPFNFIVKVEGFPVTVEILPEITGVYDGVVESMNIKNADVTRWQVRLLVTMKLRSGIADRDITLNQTLTYSDNPSGQITLLRESAVIDLGEFGEHVLPGEQRELTTYVKF